MKKKLISLSTLLIFVFLFFTGCQKETQLNEETPVSCENGLQSLQSLKGDNAKDQCRLISINSNIGFTSTFTYNQKQLAKSWTLSWDNNENIDLGTFQYNNKDLLTMAKYDFNGVPYSDAVPRYDNKDRVIKTIWYEPNTTNIVDEVFYTYDNSGHMVRQQSFMWGIDAHLVADAQGNYSRFDTYIDGIPVQSAVYTHYRSNKNPFTAISGQPFSLLYYTLVFSKWWETSESIIFYDEVGNPYFLWDQDPARTEMKMGKQNYLVDGKFYDRITGDLYHYWFDYEDCGKNNVGNISLVSQQGGSGFVKNKKSEFMKVMMSRGKAFREGLLNLRNDVIKKGK
ncbi:MAG: hypothetical protein ABIR78_02785 [Ferruginibacter sp.]